jgi:hypothetical protein
MAYSAENNSKLIQLNAELDKTVVISDQFKQFIMSLASAAAEEAVSVNIDKKAEEVNLEEEFLSRQFSGKASVRLKCRNMSELMIKVNSSVGLSRGLGIYIGKYYPNKSGLTPLLTSDYTEVLTVREWLWMEINTHIDRFAEVVGL